MKKLLSLILITLLITTSCQVENDDLEDSINTAELELTISKEQDSSSNSNLRNLNTNSDAEELHRNMSWIAFLTFEALKINDEVKNDFINRLNGKNNILLYDVLGPQIPDDSPFKQTFIQMLQEFGGITDNGCDGCSPAPSGSKPPPPLGNLDDTPGFTDGNTQFSILDIFDGILEFECIEIVFPYKELSPGPLPPFTFLEGVSLGHHMQSGEYSIEGIYHYFINNTITNPITSNHPHGLESSLVLLVRPRVDSRNGCLYSEYNNIDFKQFLNN